MTGLTFICHIDDHQKHGSYYLILIIKFKATFKARISKSS